MHLEDVTKFVHIGGTDPNGQLHVEPKFAASKVFIVEALAQQDGNLVTIQDENDVPYFVIGSSGALVATSSATFTDAVGIGAVGLSTGTLVVRSTSTTATNPVLNLQNNAGTELMRVQEDGNVGIGIPSPNSILSFKMGTGTGQAQASGKADVNTTAVGNVGAGDDDLMTFSLPADSLSADGNVIRISVWGTTAANANTKTIKLHFGATIVRQIGPSAVNNQDWRIEATVVRTGASAQDAIGTELVDNSSVFITHSEPAEDTTGAIVIKVSAESGSSASDDITQEGMLVEYIN